MNEVFWSSTPFRVSTGHGGAVAASGANHVTIRDSVFRANEAPQGATLRISSTLSARITNASIDEPADEWSSAISAFGASVATCLSNPCPIGSSCAFRDHSTVCMQCGPNEISTDGISCAACPPGSQPNLNQNECTQCESGRASTIGICTFCAAGKTSSVDRTGCIPCQPGTSRDAEEASECTECESGRASIDGICTLCLAGKISTADRTGCIDCGVHRTAVAVAGQSSKECGCADGFYDAVDTVHVCFRDGERVLLAPPSLFVRSNLNCAWF